MKKKLFLGVSMLMISGVLVACNGEIDSNNEKSEIENKQEVKNKQDVGKTEVNKADKKLSAEQQYQAVLDEYSVKIKETTPRLIEEYKNEAVNNQEGLSGLAEIANSKVQDLAKISNDGVQEMAKIMMNVGSGKYEDYEAWAVELMDIYSDEAEKIMNVYSESAM